MKDTRQLNTRVTDASMFYVHRERERERRQAVKLKRETQDTKGRETMEKMGPAHKTACSTCSVETNE